ncbi:protein obstructor-E-like [Oppia nitens]|uniref:protein obstructor-E-like n=1 Tax=Oppia nitens TaxID=1686743 RepID=UPI0023DC056D|nr:protein obstructor-E-like [Oppia nitens]
MLSTFHLIAIFGTVLLSFDYTFGQLHCPPEGIYAYEHPKACDQYFLCTNGSLTHEFCPNGLAHAIDGAVYGFCTYNWKVDCKDKLLPDPISSHGCPWQFGTFSEGDPNLCNPHFSECVWGVPERKDCQKGLFYDDRIKGCNWPEKVGCSSDRELGFSCPHEDKQNKYYPYPRYFHSDHSIITCVDNQPRLVNCGEEELVDANSLTCQPIYKEEKLETRPLLSRPVLAPIRHRFN